VRLWQFAERIIAVFVSIAAGTFGYGGGLYAPRLP
jgi:hypothetical protein